MNDIRRRHWAHLSYLSPAKIELSLEIQHHPNLMEQLVNPEEDRSFESKLALIALYCGIPIDGVYTAQEVDRMCDMLTDKLRIKRSIIALPPSARLH